MTTRQTPEQVAALLREHHCSTYKRRTESGRIIESYIMTDDGELIETTDIEKVREQVAILNKEINRLEKHNATDQQSNS